jgi:hypothetical protein
MTLADNRDVKSANTGSEPTPPGATRWAFDREDNGGMTPATPLGDRHAQGTPAGGTSVGGLGRHQHRRGFAPEREPGSGHGRRRGIPG